jgi:hypothetical protein
MVTDHAKGINDVHTADDGDGDLDLYSASGVGDTVAWYEQTRTPAVTFVEHVIIDTLQYPRSSFAADLNFDGRLDLMSASAEDNTVAWFENKGGVGLSWALRILAQAMDEAWHIYAATLDGDGDRHHCGPSAIIRLPGTRTSAAIQPALSSISFPIRLPAFTQLWPATPIMTVTWTYLPPWNPASV